MDREWNAATWASSNTRISSPFACRPLSAGCDPRSLIYVFVACCCAALLFPLFPLSGHRFAVVLQGRASHDRLRAGVRTARKAQGAQAAAAARGGGCSWTRTAAVGDDWTTAHRTAARLCYRLPPTRHSLCTFFFSRFPLALFFLGPLRSRCCASGSAWHMFMRPIARPTIPTLFSLSVFSTRSARSSSVALMLSNSWLLW